MSAACSDRAASQMVVVGGREESGPCDATAGDIVPAVLLATDWVTIAGLVLGLALWLGLLVAVARWPDPAGAEAAIGGGHQEEGPPPPARQDV